MRIVTVKDFDALKPFAADWNHLCLGALQHTPMLSYAWLVTYLEYFLELGESWFFLFALNGDQLVGVLPILVTPRRGKGRNHALLRTPFNMHTASVDFLIKPGMEDEVLPALLDGLQGVAPERMGLELLRIPAASPTVQALYQPISDSIVIKEFNGKGSFINTTGSFDDYKGSLSHNFNRNLSKANNKLAKLPNVRTIFLSGLEADPKHIDTLMAVESAGWKGKAGTAISSSEVLKAFYTVLIKRLSELGWLEWHILYTNDRPIAVHFAIKMGRTLVLNKIGYDEEFSSYAPGNILLERTIQRAFKSDDTDEINCLTDMPWHNNWAMIKKDYYDFWIYPRRPIPIIYGVMPAIIRQWGRSLPVVKALYKRVRFWK
ncbi:MAG TPA: hypothetical protein DEO84_02185 [candidate division Zixibacteria bacterium]|jgi:hypothetical protein|nr:hypothetical protein [candidate division Zixibacteria bacterium]HBZ00106.1 hypothetical protein [candidate division Zixibacteria bacterium]